MCALEFKIEQDLQGEVKWHWGTMGIFSESSPDGSSVRGNYVTKYNKPVVR